MKHFKLLFCIVLSIMALTACNKDEETGSNPPNTSKPYVIGLDLGGTNSVFGIVDKNGNILETKVIKTSDYEQAEDYVDACVKAIQPMIDQVGGIAKIKAMGIGAPSANYYTGTIECAANLT